MTFYIDLIKNNNRININYYVNIYMIFPLPA